MTTLRWYKATGTSPAVSLRVFKVSATGASVSVPTLRVFQVSATGTTAPVLSSFVDDTLEPMTAATLTAVPDVTSSVPDSYVWRVVSGAANLTGAGTATVSFTTPTPMPPTPSSLTLGVRAIKDGFSSVEVFCNLTILPQVRWTYLSGAWVGLKPTTIP